ncbi:MAG: hypothetical protein F6K37_22870 [Moorea sp. SIO4E2]|uniref:hypothetical protein n=1 Tax=Moorena sp. SIO4E2 TaxID=2607826 RepID=UPI0013BB7EE4|nr:hypothetical protein [Moorena sp. SIO4E2]NEQ08686.1 hypothetical protein [Moorena sp. SIO4E2]
MSQQNDDNDSDVSNAGNITINASKQVIVSGNNPNFSPNGNRINDRMKRQQKDLDRENHRIKKETAKLLYNQDKLEKTKDKLPEK